MNDSTEIRFYYINDDRTNLTFTDSIILANEIINSFDFTENSLYIYFSGRTGNGNYKIKKIKMSDYSVASVHDNQEICTVSRGKDGSIYYGNGDNTDINYIENPEGVMLALLNTEINNSTVWSYSGNLPYQAHIVYDYAPDYFAREIGYKNYQTNSHLGNVTATFTDVKQPNDETDFSLGFTANVISLSDFYSFGSLSRSYNNSNSYRFGFNGQEKDDEVFGSTGTALSFKYRIYDSRIGKFLSVDPLASSYPWNSTYAFAENQVIWAKDLEGKERYIVIHEVTNNKKTKLTVLDYSDINPNKKNGSMGSGTAYFLRKNGKTSFIKYSPTIMDYIAMGQDYIDKYRKVHDVDSWGTDNPDDNQGSQDAEQAPPRIGDVELSGDNNDNSSDDNDNSRDDKEERGEVLRSYNIPSSDGSATYTEGKGNGKDTVKGIFITRPANKLETDSARKTKQTKQ